MTATITIWSDIHCPWATVTVHRLRRERERQGLDVVFELRAWPLELINEEGTPRRIMEQEIAVLGNHEPELFSRFDGESWPSTFMPAFELVAAARRVGGARAAEEVDYALRRRFFRSSADVSLRHELRQAVLDAGLDAGAVMHVWDTEPVRADVLTDYERSKELPIQGSPTVFWPNGERTVNPGFTVEFVRGLPRILDADPTEPGRLLARAMRRNTTSTSGVSHE